MVSGDVPPGILLVGEELRKEWAPGRFVWRPHFHVRYPSTF
jgi:hypothetical protein